MEYYHIFVGPSLTSHKFYHELLPQLRTYAKKRESTPILFDFMDTKSVSPLVIPNLLCLGNIIKMNYNHTPTIFVPDNSASDSVRSYLHSIGFVHLAKYFGLFRFTNSIDYGTTRQMVAPLCATHLFNPDPNGKNDESAVRTQIHQHFGTFFDNYLSNFKYISKDVEMEDEGESNICNLAENLCTQLVYNCLDHGKSFAFMTAQINLTLNKVYLSIADCGIGFKASINQQISASEEPFKDRTKQMESELEAIVNAIFARANEIYGIYLPITHVLKLGGSVRLHSVDTRLILTSNMLIRLEVASHGRNDIAKMRESFLSLLRNQLGTSNRNVETGIKCGGTHIEVEIPLKKEDAPCS